MMEQKIQKLFAARTKLETELKAQHSLNIEAIDRKDRRARVETLINSCKEVYSSAVEKNEELKTIATRATNKDEILQSLEIWLKDFISHHESFITTGRDYIDSLSESRNSKAASVMSDTSKKSEQPRKTISSKGSGTSSQRKERKLARMRREEIEKQNEAEYRIAQQKLQAQEAFKRLALEEQMAKNKLALEEQAEKNRQRLAQAVIEEAAIEDSGESDAEEDELSLPSVGRDQSNKRTENWVGTSSFEPRLSNNPSVFEIQSAFPPALSEANNKALETSTNTVNVTIPNEILTVTDRTVVEQQPPVSQTNQTFQRTQVQLNPNSAQLRPLQSQTTNVISLPGRLHSVMTPGIASQPIPSVTCSHSQQPNCHPKPYNAQPVPSIAYGLNPSQWQFPPESLNAIPSSNSLPNTAFPTSQNFIAPLYQNSLHHPIAAQPSALTGSGPTWILTQPVQTVPSYSAQPIGNQTTKELANLLTVSRKDPLPEWKLSNFDGNPLDWNEWFGQFRSAVDASPLSDDVKMTYLKTLVSGKAKNAIEGFAYCGAMYKDALRALERKFGQPQTVVSAHLDKLSAYPPVKMHSSENVIQYASLVASLVAVFQSLGYNADLNSSSLLNQAVSKLPPNLKESWSFQTVKRNLLRPTLLDFNSWIQEKAEAHDRMLSTSKSKLDSSVATSIKPKTTKTFSSTAQNRESDPCVLCNGKHPLFKCPVFKEKTPTQRAKFCAESKLCFSCLRKNHNFRQCPSPRKCPKENCKSTHNVLLHGAERIFSPRSTIGTSDVAKPETQGTSKGFVTNESSDQNSASTTMCSTCPSVKGLLQIVEVYLEVNERSLRTFALCDSACSHSWIAKDAASKLNVTGPRMKLTVNGINSTKAVETEKVDLTVRSIEPSSHESFSISPYVKNEIDIGNETLDLKALKDKYPHLEPVPGEKIHYSDVKLILGQDAYEAIRPLEYFTVRRTKDTPLAVRLALGWVLSGPVPSTVACPSTCFTATSEQNDELAQVVKSWYDLESYGTYKTVDSKSQADARAMDILESTTFCDGVRYHVGMLWADSHSTLPNNYYASHS